MIDHTLLKPDATRKDIEALCREAAEYSLRASASIRPGSRVFGCCAAVRSRSVRWSSFRWERRRPTRSMKHGAIFDGAREIDMVINVGALKSGDLRLVERDIEAVTAPCREGDAVSKVIIEAALLTDDERSRRARWPKRPAPIS